MGSPPDEIVLMTKASKDDIKSDVSAKNQNNRYSVEIFFLLKKTLRPFGDLSDTKKKRNGCPQIEFKIFPKVATQHRRRRAAFSLSFTKRMRAHQREAEESVWNRRSVVFLLFLLVVVI